MVIDMQDILLVNLTLKLHFNMTDKELQSFIDELLPPMNEKEQKQMLKQVVEISNKDSQRLAEIDPLANIPLA